MPYIDDNNVTTYTVYSSNKVEQILLHINDTVSSLTSVYSSEKIEALLFTINSAINTLTSTYTISEIDAMLEAINTAIADLPSVYSKSEVDAMIADIIAAIPSLPSVYTKTEVDGLLLHINDNTPSLTTVYSSAKINQMLSTLMVGPGIHPDTNYVRITTTGSTFSPIVELSTGSNAVVSWEVEGGSTYTGIAPVINFGTEATRYIRLKAVNTGNDAIGSIVTFNIGFNNEDDKGNYYVGSAYNHAPQDVAALEYVNRMTGLIRFLAVNNNLVGTIDFTGMSNLQYIECYRTPITQVILTGCTALIRLCIEGCPISNIDLNPVAGNLYDLRTANSYVPLTFATLTSPLTHLYHFCVVNRIVYNHPPASQFPVIEELWDYNSSQSGELVIQSLVINSLLSSNNHWNSVTFNPSLTDRYRMIFVENNNLNTTAIDSILNQVVSWGSLSGGEIFLTGNCGPSSVGITDRDILVNNGWTVATEAQDYIPSLGTVLWSDNFDRPDVIGIDNVGNGWHTQLDMDADIVSSNLVLRSDIGYCILLTTNNAILPADYTVSMTLPIGSKGTNFGLVGRWSNDEGIKILFTDSETSMFVSGASGYDINYVDFDSTPVFPTGWTNPNIVHTVAMKMQGTAITIILDGQIAATCTCNINSTITGTQIGFCGEAQSRIRPLIEVTSI